MSPLEKQELIGKELSAFKQALPDYDDAPLVVQLATKRIRERIFDSDLTIRQVKERLGITSSTFAARFRRYHRRTPKRYARHLRVKAAKRLFRYEELSIMEIAFEVGYENYRTFARVFKRHAGCSPAAFRDDLPE